MTTQLSDFADSLSGAHDPPFKTFLLMALSKAEEGRWEVETERDAAYWQGRKDALRLVLAEYLNDPAIAGLNANSMLRLGLLQEPATTGRDDPLASITRVAEALGVDTSLPDLLRGIEARAVELGSLHTRHANLMTNYANLADGAWEDVTDEWPSVGEYALVSRPGALWCVWARRLIDDDGDEFWDVVHGRDLDFASATVAMRIELPAASQD